jgi:ferredoxin-NADP reductase
MSVDGQRADAPWIEARLTAIERVARDTNLYRFERPDGGPLPGWTAGSHIDVELAPDLVRQFSLIDRDGDPSRYAVAVKRDPASRGGSRFLHDTARVGGMFRISAPRNHFPLAEDAANSLLIAGGIGITPLLSMARVLDLAGRPHALVYAARSRHDAAFARELAGRDGVTLHFDDEAGAPFDLGVLDTVPIETHVYCCGPAAMLEAFAARAGARFPAAQVHIEYFTARDDAATDGGFTVTLARSGRSLAVPAGSSILDMVLAAGVDVPHSCREGVCGSCETAVVEGLPDHRDAILSPQERAAGRSMMICCSGAKSDRLVLDL